MLDVAPKEGGAGTEDDAATAPRVAPGRLRLLAAAPKALVGRVGAATAPRVPAPDGFSTGARDCHHESCVAAASVVVVTVAVADEAASSTGTTARESAPKFSDRFILRLREPGAGPKLGAGAADAGREEEDDEVEADEDESSESTASGGARVRAGSTIRLEP